MITPEWIAILAALGGKASAVVGIFLCGYLILIGVATGVAVFHPKTERRADARKVLKRLLPHRGGPKSLVRAPKTLPPPGDDERPQEQVASVPRIDRARPKRRG